MLKFLSFLKNFSVNSRKLTNFFGVVSLGLLVGLSVQFARAWTPPTGIPPSGNLAGPLNTGATAQTKTGQLNITGGGASGIGGIVIGKQSLWSNAADQWLYLANNLNNSWTAGQGIAMANLWANKIMYLGAGAYIYDTDLGGAYFVDPSSTSNMYIVKRYGGFDDANGGEVDVNNPSYKVNPSGDTYLNRLCLNAICSATWPSGGVAGSGTLNKIPLWTPNGTTLGDSPLTVSGNNVTGAGTLSSVGGGIYGRGAIVFGSQSLNSNANGWLYEGDAAGNVYNGTGLATDNLYAATSLQTRVMYDRDNTTFMADPFSTSVFNALDVEVIYDVNADGTTLNGYYLDPSAASKVNRLDRSWGFGVAEVDANNAGFQVDPDGTTKLNILCLNGDCKAAWPAGGGAEADTLQTVTTRGNTTNLRINAASLKTTNFAIADPRWDASVYVLEAGYWYDHSDGTFMYMGEGASSIIVRGNIRAPIFYDQDNTTYRVDPNGSTYLSSLETAAWSTFIDGPDFYLGGGFPGRPRGLALVANGAILNVNYAGQFASGTTIGSTVLILNDGTVQGTRFVDTNDPTYVLDPASTTTLNTVFANVFWYSSDENLKKNIVTIPDALQSVLNLRGVRFNWKKDDTLSVGLIAQEVEKVYPELVSTDPETGLKSVEYGNLVGPLVEAVKALNQKVENVLTQGRTTEAEVRAQAAKIADQEHTIQVMQKEIDLLGQK